MFKGGCLNAHQKNPVLRVSWNRRPDISVILLEGGHAAHGLLNKVDEATCFLASFETRNTIRTVQ